MNVEKFTFNAANPFKMVDFDNFPSGSLFASYCMDSSVAFMIL